MCAVVRETFLMSINLFISCNRVEALFSVWTLFAGCMLHDSNKQRVSVVQLTARPVRRPWWVLFPVPVISPSRFGGDWGGAKGRGA